MLLTTKFGKTFLAITKEQFYELSVPMISLCDVPLTRLKAHVGTYGKYAIGLSKGWANRKQLNPVFYTAKGSLVAHHLQESLFLMHQNLTRSNRQPGENKVLNILKYVKNFEGPLERSNGKVKPNYKFADEREWRYVPNCESENIEHYLPPKKKFLTKPKYREHTLEEHQAKARSIKLQFDVEDIQYILVAKEKQRASMLKFLEKVYGDARDIDVLKSRVLTLEQISRDF